MQTSRKRSLLTLLPAGLNRIQQKNRAEPEVKPAVLPVRNTQNGIDVKATIDVQEGDRKNAEYARFVLASATSAVGVRSYRLSDREALRFYFDSLSKQTRFKRLHATTTATPDSLLNLYVCAPDVTTTTTSKKAVSATTQLTSLESDTGNALTYTELRAVDADQKVPGRLQRYCCVAYLTDFPEYIIGEAILAVDPSETKPKTDTQNDKSGDHCQKAKTAEIGLSVSDAHQRQGVATQLMQHLEVSAKAMAVNGLYADAYGSNKEFIAFALSHGYQKKAHQHDRSLVRLTKATNGTSDQGVTQLISR